MGLCLTDCGTQETKPIYFPVNYMEEKTPTKTEEITIEAASLLRKIMQVTEWDSKDKKELKKILLTLSRVVDML